MALHSHKDGSRPAKGGSPGLNSVVSVPVARSNGEAEPGDMRSLNSTPPQTGPQKTRPQWTALYETCLVLLFIFLTSVGITHHELWRDETQSWLLARDSPSLLALFQNAHYEGHPLLWHYCLYIISRVNRSIFAMQAFNLLLAIGSAWLIVKKSPFSLLERSLIIFGYFTFFEYTLLARSYGLGVFLTFLFCALYCDRRLLTKWQAWCLTLTLALLANTSILGLVMSGVLAITLYYRLSIAPAQSARTSIGSHFFVLLLSWAASAFQIVRSLFNPMGLEGFSSDRVADMASNDTAQRVIQQTTESTLLSDSLENADKLLQIVLKSHFPLPTFRFHFWNQHLLESQTVLNPDVHTTLGIALLTLSAALVVAILFMAFQLLRKTRLFLFVYGLGCLSMTAIFVLAYRGSTRHYGHLFILLLVCLWLSRWSRQYFNRSDIQPLSTKVSAAVFTVVLIVQALAGGYAYTSDLLYPFSASYQTAQVIETRLDPLPILAINQRPISPISGYIDREIFYPEADKFGSFWDISYPEITEETDVVEAIELFSSTHSDFIAVLTLPLGDQSLVSSSELSIQYLAYIGPSIVEDEAFFLYQVSAS